MALVCMCSYQFLLAARYGYVQGRYHRVHRSHSPGRFWFNVCLYGLISVFGLCWAIVRP
jgi:hypothetical protein